MRLLEQILEFNRNFVENKDYEQYQTTKLPNKKLVILSCMDTRLMELLPQAMNVKNGDVKIIKNAGAVVSHPFGSIMRSILVAVYELNVEEICIVGHYDCGMNSLNGQHLLEKARDRGVTEETISTLTHAGVDLGTWLKGVNDVKESVTASVDRVRMHPLFPKDVPVHGLVIDPETGRLDQIIDGYEQVES